jgi:hypothetical protein
VKSILEVVALVNPRVLSILIRKEQFIEIIKQLLFSNYLTKFQLEEFQGKKMLFF